MERTVTTVRARSRAGEEVTARLSGVAGGDVRQVCEELEVEIQGGELHRQRSQLSSQEEAGTGPRLGGGRHTASAPETQGEGEGAQEPQVWMFLLQGGDGPAQQIPTPAALGRREKRLRLMSR